MCSCPPHLNQICHQLLFYLLSISVSLGPQSLGPRHHFSTELSQHPPSSAPAAPSQRPSRPRCTLQPGQQGAQVCRHNVNPQSPGPGLQPHPIWSSGLCSDPNPPDLLWPRGLCRGCCLLGMHVLHLHLAGTPGNGLSFRHMPSPAHTQPVWRCLPHKQGQALSACSHTTQRTSILHTCNYM